LVGRLDLGDAAEQEIALLVGDCDLLSSAAARADGLTEERVVQIASHLDKPETTRALYLLTLARGGLEPSDRERLDELLDLVLALLSRPGVADLEARNLVERKRAEARRLTNGMRDAVERIDHAPRAYVVHQSSADIARHAALLDPLPPRGRARVTVQPVDEQRWQI